MTLLRLFLDTNVLVSGTALPRLNPYAERIMAGTLSENYTNEYAIKETRRVLQERFKVPINVANDAIEFIRQHATVVATPPVDSFIKYDIVDKSDRPIVCSAVQLCAILVTEDRLLRKEATRYVKSVSSSEAWRLCKDAKP
ncbi:MAG: PIN domain-containing protein [Candidatus Micrarchaeota archaeon]